MNRFIPAALAVLVLAAACERTTSPSLLNDTEITADIAASSGDAIATALETLTGNELAGALPYSLPYSTSAGEPTGNDVVVQRSRTCYDGAGAVLTCGQSGVRKVVTHVAIDGSRTGTRTNQAGATVTFTGAVHRVLDDTLTRVFNTAQPPAETSRIHAGVSSGKDTTTFTDGTISRKANESFVDSVRAITYNLPRSSNPWPVSGSIVRNASINVTLTGENRNESRSVTRRSEVTFPADAQGNVVLKINDKTCNLNLVTHRVTNCQ